jgi:hypothetical protein
MLEVGLKMGSALQAILEQLENFRKNMSAGQDILAVCQEELTSED